MAGDLHLRCLIGLDRVIGLDCLPSTSIVIEADSLKIFDADLQRVATTYVECWRSPIVIYFMVGQLLAFLVALADINGIRFGLVSRQHSCSGYFLSNFEQLGSHLKVLFCLVASISHPLWVSIPFFIGICVGLVDWSLTSNFLGLFRWWRALLLYEGFNIVLLYMYQLPIEYSAMLQSISEFIGQYRMPG